MISYFKLFLCANVLVMHSRSLTLSNVTNVAVNVSTSANHPNVVNASDHAVLSDHKQQNSITGLNSSVNANANVEPNRMSMKTNLEPSANGNITTITTKSLPTAVTTKSSTVSKITMKSIAATSTTTTKRPTKPKIVYSMESRPQWGDLKLFQASGSKVASAETPLVQPSQEFISNGFTYQHRNDYVVPIFFAIFIIPLAIFAVLTVYRRFRDLWSTRHYRRMDFLIDGMYNE